MLLRPDEKPVLDALDRSLDPNMDGDFSDKADIINMSLGSDFGPADDPQNDLIDALSRQGILSVIAAGNAGDAHEISGSPGSARSALTVANSQGSLEERRKVAAMLGLSLEDYTQMLQARMGRIFTSIVAEPSS